jgi:hypothetical protein
LEESVPDLPGPLHQDIFKLVRYFLTGRQPAPRAVLLVESGSRGILEGVIPGLRQRWGNAVPIDLLTCYANLPKGFEPENTRAYRVREYRGREGRRKLYRELLENRYSLVGIVCSGEPVMNKWKWLTALRLPAKVFVINENGDYFWLDRKHLGIIRQFVILRAGLEGAGAVRCLARAISFPFTLAYLLLYATTIHAGRALRRT